jgi:hypothetical protein
VSSLAAHPPLIPEPITMASNVFEDIKLLFVKAIGI